MMLTRASRVKTQFLEPNLALNSQPKTKFFKHKNRHIVTQQQLINEKLTGLFSAVCHIVLAYKPIGHKKNCAKGTISKK